MSKLRLVLLIHAHQPVGNFDEVLERAYARCYLPFVESLLRHPSVRLGLHYSGVLLEWMERRHPEFFELLRALASRGQVELVGGGFYEPILISIPSEDRLEQICRLADYLQKHFGLRPKGAWLAERVWEPQLPSTLAPAGVEYTLVDDNHFLAAGFEPAQLHGYYIAEDLGATLKVIPGLKALRYLIPFRSVEENIDFLRWVAQEHPGGLAAMGDDCEKFGVWPSTYDHCYRDGWLERFFAALEANSDWLATVTPADYLASALPLGRADLPTACYTEMTEWALPTPMRERFHTVQQQFASRPDVLALLNGGFWRGFLSKYPEANLLHKKMLYVSEKVRQLARNTPAGTPSRADLDEALACVLRAQCNDAYWHGIFGGLYAPHLRTALWRELVRAETLADAARHVSASYAEIARLDFDADGCEEIYLSSDGFAALLKPSDGGTLAAMDFRTAGVALINSLQRRREAYHSRLGEAGGHSTAGVVSIHDQVRAKEAGLERCLRYDRWARHAFRVLLFDASKTYQDYEAVRLEESATFAGGPYRVTSASAQRVELACEGTLLPQGSAARAIKSFSFTNSSYGLDVACELALSHDGPDALRLQAGLEVVLNLLAPNEPDRYFESAGGRHPLGWGGAVPASRLRAVDEWQNVALAIEAPAAREFWVAPIETVSESEQGFERVYQGSQILAVWPIELGAGALWTARLTLRLARAR